MIGSVSTVTMTANQTSNSKPRLSLPVLQGLLPFDKVRIGPDIMAGITLAALGIPEVMGYTKIIGTPVITGLYTLFLPVLIYALFGSSRHLVVRELRNRSHGGGGLDFPVFYRPHAEVYRTHEPHRTRGGRHTSPGQKSFA
jgi:hypothetical protein